MRPYLAIIRDSFREALASRVLWMLIVLITLILLAIAPLGYERETTIGVSSRDVAENDWPLFIERIRDQGQKDEPSPARRIFQLLDEDMQRRVANFKPPEAGDISGAFEYSGTIERFPQALTDLVKNPDFYDAASWSDVTLYSREVRLLLKEGVSLTDEQIQRRNRLVLEAGFPDLVRASGATSIRLKYLFSTFGPPLPFGADELEDAIHSTVAWVMKWVIGPVGLFVAILVTAPIVPQTFDPGSLSLLLSKPISRWLLFLSKFLGGCAFIFINGAYLIVGISLVLGARFGVWDAKLLWLIPIYVFAFAIYYSVSAFAGVYWRSTVVSIVVSILFWAGCFLLALVKGQAESWYLDKVRVAKLVPLGDQLMVIDETGFASIWDDTQQNWKEAFVSKDQKQFEAMRYMMPTDVLPQPIGPLYDASGERVIAINRAFGPGGFGAATLSVGTRTDAWASQNGAAVPSGVIELLPEPGGGTLAIAPTAIYRLVGDPVGAKPLEVFGFTVPLPGSGPFRSIGPAPPVVMTRPAAAAINPDTGVLALYTRGTLTLLAPGKDAKREYHRQLEQDLEIENDQSVLLAFAGSTLLVADELGRLHVLDADTLRPRQVLTPEGKNQPRFARGAPGGRYFAIAFHNGRLWILDTQGDRISQPSVSGQEDISAIEFSGPEQLLVADRTNRVIEYRLGTTERLRSFSPSLSTIEWVYRYAIVPLYTLFPKPADLNNTVKYVLSGKETESRRRNAFSNLGAAQENLDPWPPVWSGLAFTAVMLVLACVYIQREEY